jgi:hypothetical protein
VQTTFREGSFRSDHTEDEVEVGEGSAMLGMAAKGESIREVIELRRAYEHAFSEVGTVIYLLVGCLVVLGIAAALRLVWGSGKITTFKPFDPSMDRKKDRGKRRTRLPRGFRTKVKK